MAKRSSNDCYSDEEAQRRFEAALRGARAVGPLPMKELPSKRAKRTDRRDDPGREGSKSDKNAPA